MCILPKLRSLKLSIQIVATISALFATQSYAKDPGVEGSQHTASVATTQLACRFTGPPIDARCLDRSGARVVTGSRVFEAHGHRFPEALQVYRIPLSALPQSDRYALTRRGTDVVNEASTFEMFQGETRFRPARWPENVFLQSIKLDSDKKGVIIPGELFARFADEPSLWLGGYWTSNYAFETSPILSKDPAHDRLVFDRLKSTRPVRASFPFYFLNAFAALNRPGDYVFDTSERAVYAASTNGTSQFEIGTVDNLLEIHNARDLHLSGLKLRKALGTALIIRDSENVTVDGCDIRHMGKSAILVEGGTHVVISNCKIDDIAETAVTLKGGDRTTLTPAGHVIKNSEITNFDLDSHTYHPGVLLAGVGNRVENNVIKQSTHSGIMLQGNDHVIRGNTLSKLVTEGDDAGAIYVVRDWTERGTVIEDNWFSDIGMPNSVDPAATAGRTYLSGIYLDDQESGYGIFRNIFYNVSRPIVIHGGRDNVVENNAFLQCEHEGITLNRRGEGLSGGTLEKRLNAVPFATGIWAQRYPALATIKENRPGEPLDNKASGNVAIGCKLFSFTKKTSPSVWPDIGADSRELPADPQDHSAAAMLKRAGLGCSQLPILCSHRE